MGKESGFLPTTDGGFDTMTGGVAADAIGDSQHSAAIGVKNARLIPASWLGDCVVDG
jgi:hypothetical protein